MTESVENLALRPGLHTRRTCAEIIAKAMTFTAMPQGIGSQAESMLLNYLPFAVAHQMIGDQITEEQWRNRRLFHPFFVAQAFCRDAGWEIANAQDPSGAVRSRLYLSAALWLAGFDTFDTDHLGPWDYFGKKQLVAACELVGVDWDQKDDGTWSQGADKAGISNDDRDGLIQRARLWARSARLDPGASLTLQVFDRTRRIIRTDGSIELLPKPIVSSEIEERIKAQGLDTVQLRHLGPPPVIMFVNDKGWEYESVRDTCLVEGQEVARVTNKTTKALFPLNEVATAMYLANCLPETEHTIVGDVAIVLDDDFAGDQL